MSMETQSVLFLKSKYTKKKAEKWLKENGFKVKKVDTTPTLHRYRQLDPKLFDEKTYRMKKIKGNDIKLVVGKRKKKKKV
jgi:hypothetical protein